MKLTFFGAAGEVTGSQHLIETETGGRFRLLLDCGLFQGARKASRAKNESFECRPRLLDAVVLSHAHIDHCGRIPQLVAAGFKGPIYCTRATADIIELMLSDSAKIQEEDAAFLADKLGPDDPSAKPLYTLDDVRQTMRQIEAFDYRDEQTIFEGVQLRFSDAGHILGSAITELTIREGTQRTRLAFTGDLGRRDMPLLSDPEPIEAPDILISECLYAGRTHPPPGDIKKMLATLVEQARQRDGRLILPAFSLGRTQQVLYFLNELWNEQSLAPIPIFVDSPLATRLTAIYRSQTDIMDDDVQETLEDDDDIFKFPTLRYIRKRDASIALNRRDDAFAVISASGMCENGRVVHHLRHGIEHPDTTICLLGYQAPRTLGRRIADRDETVRIHGRNYELNATVHQLGGLSAHADKTDLRWWFEQVAETGPIDRCFFVHGEPEMARDMAELVDDLVERHDAPHAGQSFEVEPTR